MITTHTLAGFAATLSLAFALASPALAQDAPATVAPTATTAPAATPTTMAAPASIANTGVLKIGYTNVQYLLAASPQTKVIKSQLESASRQYEKAIQDKMKDLEDKYAVYQKAEQTMMESIKQDKQNELRQIETSIRSLQENAQSELKTKENDLVKPELEKIYAGINEVAKANGYTFVLNSEQVILYASEAADITTLVMKKLGFPEPKEGDDKPTASATKPTSAAASTSAGTGSATAPKPSGTRTPSPKGKGKK